MRYTVEWLPSTLQDLAELWNNASDRSALTAAANAIDDILCREPLTAGESREGMTRIFFVEPLAVLFDVDTASRSVKVWDVWRWPR
jgi:hypothetical protein